LNLKSFAIESVECGGVMPGWIHGHRAKRTHDREIEVTGGVVETEDGQQTNQVVFRLDVVRKTWTRLLNPIEQDG
jgi:hypothetical protein